MPKARLELNRSLVQTLAAVACFVRASVADESRDS